MWYFVVRDFVGRESHGYQDEVAQLSCPVEGTPTEKPVGVVLASSWREKSKVLLCCNGGMSKLMSEKKDLHEN